MRTVLYGTEGDAPGHMKLQYNEVTFQDGYIGLFEDEPEPEKYLSIESKSDLYRDWKPEDDWEFSIELSLDKKVERRIAYTFLDLLGDFGGFNDAIYMLLSIPLGYYSSSMYSRHIASFFKVRGRRKGTN